MRHCPDGDMRAAVRRLWRACDAPMAMLALVRDALGGEAHEAAWRAMGDALDAASHNDAVERFYALQCDALRALYPDGPTVTL